MPKTELQNETIRIKRKKEILEAALKTFATKGYHASSISQVSQAAGVSKGLMYNYFSSKEELLEILIGDLFDQELELMNDLFNQEFNNEVFTEFIKMGGKILKKNPEKWMLYFSMSTQPEIMKIIQSRFTPERIAFTQKITTYFKNHFNEPELQAQYFGVVMTGFKLSFIMDPLGFPIDEIENLIIKQFVKQSL